jgi:predicted transcriptional regulator
MRKLSTRPQSLLSCPSPEQVRQALNLLSLSQLKRLAAQSGVPYMTLYKVRRGDTTEPMLSTVHTIAPHYGAAVQADAP